jgi:membrane protein YqaA with SNARE-associated domain
LIAVPIAARAVTIIDDMDALDWIPDYGYPALFVLLMLGLVGLPIPDETLLAFSGYLIFKHQFAPMPTMATAFLGSICGITISYLIGRYLGVYVVGTLGRRIGIRPENLDKVNAWYVQLGEIRPLLRLLRAGCSTSRGYRGGIIEFVIGDLYALRLCRSTHTVGDVSRVGIWIRGNMGIWIRHC